MTPANRRLLDLRRLLLKKPELLLLDEPFSGLDAPGCSEMSKLIVEWAQGGKTVILTEDSLAHSKDICERFALCYAGKLDTVGTLEEILGTPDAIRFIGRVLPPETAQRVSRAIHQDLGRPGSATRPAAPKPEGGSPKAESAARTGPVAAVATADEILAPLVRSSRREASNDVQEPAASPPDNEALASLTKPGRPASPDEPRPHCSWTDGKGP